MTTTIIDLTCVEDTLTNLIKAYDITLAAIVECPCKITPVLCPSCKLREQALDTFETEWERMASFAPDDLLGRVIVNSKTQPVISWE